MSDPHVREVGRLDDGGDVAVPLAVGVNYGTVTIGCGAIRWTLSVTAVEELAQLLVAATWQAAAYQGNVQGQLDAEAAAAGVP